MRGAIAATIFWFNCCDGIKQSKWWSSLFSRWWNPTQLYCRDYFISHYKDCIKNQSGFMECCCHLWVWLQIEARHQRLLLVPSFFETCLKLWPADSYRFPCSFHFLSAKKLQEEKNMELEENVQKQETTAILWPKNRVGFVPFFWTCHPSNPSFWW